jgi:hypothetical protein
MHHRDPGMYESYRVITRIESLAFTIVNLVSNSLIFPLFKSLYTVFLIIISTTAPVLCYIELRITPVGNAVHEI